MKKTFLTSKALHIFILLIMVAAAAFFNFSNDRWRQQIRNTAFDYYNILEPRAPGEEVVIVDIDEISLKKYGQWPWSRDTLAALVEELDKAGAKIIVFDMVFAEPDRTSPASILKNIARAGEYDDLRDILSRFPDNDLVFAQAIKDAGNVVTGFNFAEQKTDGAPAQKAGFLQKNADRYITVEDSAAINLPIISRWAAGNGGFFVQPDTDGIIRRVPMIVAFKENENATPVIYPSLSLEAIRLWHNEKAAKIMLAEQRYAELDPHRFGVEGITFIKSKLFIPTDAQGNFLVYFAEKRDDWYIPAASVLDNTVDAGELKDKIVLIGTSAVGLKDIRSTPLDAFRPGVEVHLNIIDQILQGKFLKRSIEAEGAEALAIILIGILIVIVSQFIGALMQAAFVLVLTGGILLSGWTAFTVYGQLIDVIYPSLCVLAIFMVSNLLTYLRTEAERRYYKQAFGFYISPAFMEEITKNPDKLKLGGETRELTVMFTDIRNFTTISETMSPERLIQLMNDFLTPMSDLVMESRGTIDKYMGDAMMAFWNAPLDDPDHARHACIQAMKMNEALKPINDSLHEEALRTGHTPTPLQAGIGVSTGPCAVGNMGSKQRFAYSALGDAANLASRLEGQTKAYHVNLLVSEDTLKQAPGLAALELDLLRVKGREKPVRIFTLLGDEDKAQDKSFLDWNEAHEAMMAAYRAGDFQKAAGLVAACQDVSARALEGYYTMFLTRIEQLKADPPPKGWNGVFIATSK